MISQKILRKYIFVIILLGLLVIPAASYAALPSLVSKCANNPGGCDACDAIGVGINITKIMLGTLGSAALLIFVYGGFLMLTSRGHSDQVQKGKDALINAVKGVIIVLGSWAVINYGLAIILGQSMNNVTLFDNKTNWATVACTPSQTQIAIPDNGSSTGSTTSCANIGDSCGDGYICDKQLDCVQTCEKKFGGLEYSCMLKNNSNSPGTCMTGYCPGQADDIQCCHK
ncbi:MAG: hypothetical protein A3B53_01140 [Candidatus Levybacteria bacterium RIFCSPLOWO2_01_FULL_42_15]|nr:MAG: hypothetical protein A3B53_01140 [Candidatus Levybacteria bacterium RIFCSPLOWO2_01_FULL_42_15]